ncbi:MAG: energy-coupling factor ABC transporter ATP-binding protein [Shewanella sp.]|nr:energy-coupling factor ABC transporter ATP-binding protein [Shewanella sp.]MCF1430288.1 energy-coupling factor ABC transporter ATP-binding protein [Shewanella sp.]MCF1437561.1 energy-coupling factor ABC transporter ATP-binding protein [Shewanella sp.]MCF1458455.1 energy-coupling factor ABC transporter ATP-binding protein [Shewanella sp.]
MVQLTVKNLRMQFAQRLLFTAEELHFRRGDTIYLQGDNGTGKTTLMKILAGLMPPTSGKLIWQDGQAPKWWQRHPQLGKLVYLHQHPYLYEGSVKYNLSFAGHHHKMSGKILQQRVAAAAQMAGLEHLFNADAVNLSGGERQRLAIARAWVIQPDLLMLDEPVSNMDRESTRLVMEMIHILKQQGTGLLVSSHQSCALTALCRQTWLIEDQRITASPFHFGNRQVQKESLNVITS